VFQEVSELVDVSRGRQSWIYTSEPVQRKRPWNQGVS
jgi:hypothetical protein